VHVSVITRAQLMAGSGAKAAITELMSPYRESLVDRVVAERAGRVRREAGSGYPML